MPVKTAPPVVLLVLPETDLEVKPGEEVPFFYEATDDFGLASISLVVTADDGTELSRAVVASPKNERLSRGDTNLAMASLSIDPGESVIVHFEAEDLNDLSGPGKSQSVGRRLTIYSPEAEHDRLMGKLDALIQQMVTNLADRLESPLDDDEKPNPEQLHQYTGSGHAINRHLAKIVADLSELLGSLSTDELAADAMRAKLQTVIGTLQDTQEQEAAHLRKAMLGTSQTDDSVMVMLLKGSNTEAIGETEDAILSLRQVLRQARKDRLLDAAREMLETQNEMMELLKKLKDEKDPKALKEALKKLKQLQDKLARLKQELAKLRERTPYENQNRNQRPSERQEEMSDLGSQMDQIQKLLEEGKIDEAMKMLEAMQQQTQQMMAGLENDLDSPAGAGMSPGQQKASELSAKLDELADGQAGLRKETDQVKQQMAQRQAQEAKEQMGEALEAAQALAKEVREALDGADNGAMHEADRQRLEGLQKAAEGMEQALKDGQMGQASDAAQNVAKGAGELGKEIGESEARESDAGRSDGLKESMKKLGEGQGKADQLAQQLAGMMPKPGEGASPGEAEEMEGLGERQGKLGKGLEGLQEDLRELEGQMPGIGEKLKPALDEARKKMGEAEGELKDNDAHGAENKQREALSKLQQAQDAMREQMQQRGNGSGPEQTGVVNPNEKVEIPEDDRYQAPEDFRKEVLEAIKERAPEQYRDAIKRFYEELVK